jgi:amino acid transporter
MCFSNETTLKEKINAYFIVELIISIISILCPLFFFITIVSHFCIFIKPEKSWNWDELDEEIFKSSRIKCNIILLISTIAFMLWVLICAIFVVVIIGLLFYIIILILYIVHVYYYSTVLYYHQKKIIKNTSEEITENNTEENV